MKLLLSHRPSGGQWGKMLAAVGRSKKPTLLEFREMNRIKKPPASAINLGGMFSPCRLGESRNFVSEISIISESFHPPSRSNSLQATV